MITVIPNGQASADTIRIHRNVTVDLTHNSLRLSEIADLEGAYAESFNDCVICDLTEHDRRIAKITIELDEVRRAIDRNAARTRVNWARLSLNGGRCEVRLEDAALKREGILKGRTGSMGKGKIHESAEDDLSKRSDSQEERVWADESANRSTVQGVISSHLVRSLLREHDQRLRLTFDRKDQKVYSLPVEAGVDLEVMIRSSHGSSRVPLLINMYRKDELLRSERLTVQVEIQRSVVVVDHYVPRGQMITESDLHEEVRLINPYTITPTYSVKDVNGLVAVSRLVMGQILSPDDVRKPILVKRRSNVIVRAKVGAFIVRMPAVALESGEVGQVIRVQRPGRGAPELLARVEANGEVVVVESNQLDTHNRSKGDER